MRAHIAQRGEAPHHVVQPVPEVAADVRDSAGLTEDEVLAELSTLARHPFALDRELPMRIHLRSRGPREHLLLFVIHHIVVDGHSLPWLMATLWDACDRALAGEAALAGPVDTGFEAFVAWQRDWLKGDAAAADLEYWRPVLAAPWPRLAFGDAPRRGASGERSRTLSVAPDLAARIGALARTLRVTVSTVFLAAYRIVLARFSGESDIMIGTAVMTRPSERYHQSVGLFVNMVALRAVLVETQRASDLVVAEHRALANAVQHGAYPFPRLVRELKLRRKDAGGALHEAAFSFVGSGLMDWGASTFGSVTGRSLEALPQFSPAAGCDLMLEVHQTASGFDLVVKHDLVAMDETLIDRMLGDYVRILDDMTADPFACVADVGRAAEAARSAVPDAAVPSAVVGNCVHHRFELEARLHPEAVAVHHRGAQIGYGALNARANQLARYLCDKGVGVGSRVGLYGRGSPAFLIGALAVLKAGAAYLPLDPAYPRQRILNAAADAELAALLVCGGSDDGLREALPALTVVDLDAGSPPWLDQETTDLGTRAAPGDLAYVMYTSGSTGAPKAVMVEHRNLAHAMEACRPHYGITAADRILQMASTSFDVSVLEIFSALTAGAALVLGDENWLESPRRFRARCAENAVTVAFLPASLWHHLLVEDGLAPPPDLRLVGIGGEPAHPDWVRKWFALRTEAPRLLNHYGPTEATITATIAELAPDAERVLIGHPLDGVALYVLDDRGALVPEGETGELFIGGAGVARGYLNRPELTAERFVPDVFSGMSGARLYRTGDLVCRQPSGALAFCGRADRQVKLRGFRIELEEIEAQLVLHPRIADAAVIVLEEDDATRRLVAYVKMQDGSALSPNEIRLFLGRVLPDHMIPASFVALDAFPLTASGKRDLDALATFHAQPVSATFVAPRTSLEETLATIFAQVLKRDRVGIHDNFFEIGGDSFSATQVIARIWDALEVEVTPQLFFELQNVAELAEEIAVLAEEKGGVLPCTS